MIPKTVRVKIALAVTPEGKWGAAGDSAWDLADRVRNTGLHESPYAKLVWIEADVPIPEPETIQGEVKP